MYIHLRFIIWELCEFQGHPVYSKRFIIHIVCHQVPVFIGTRCDRTTSAPYCINPTASTEKNTLSRIWKRCPPTLFFQRVRIGSVNYSSTDRLWMWFPAENIYSTSYAAVRICRYFIRNNRNWRDAVSDNARSQARFSSGNVFFFVLYYLCVYTSFQSIASVLFYRCFPETPAVAKLKKMTF